MAVVLQATAVVRDWARLEAGLKWLSEEVGHADGLIRLRILRDQADPQRVTMLEEWESNQAFQASFPTYSLEQRAEFLSRLGLTAEDFERSLWETTDLEFGPDQASA